MDNSPIYWEELGITDGYFGLEYSGDTQGWLQVYKDDPFHPLDQRIVNFDRVKKIVEDNIKNNKWTLKK